MKFFLLLFFSLAPSFLPAQSILLKEIIHLTNPGDGEYYYPKFSNDGTKIFFTKDNYKGIYSYDLEKKSLKMLNDESGAGYEFDVNSSGNLVYYRSDRYINGRKYSTLKSLNTASGVIQKIVTDKRDLSTPRYIGNNKIVYSVKDKITVVAGNNTLKKSVITSADKPFVLIEKSGIALYTAGKKKLLSPMGRGNYIWPSVSPDNTKLLFTCAGKGTFVSDLNGNIISKIGYANYPQWSPDGKWISYMVDKDNGYSVISSDVYISSWDGKKTFKITDTPDIYEMYPEWSPEGNRIAVNTYDGKILILVLNIEERGTK